MATVYIPTALRTLIAQRANFRCEYCLIHQDDTPFTHSIDHIIALKHGGATIAENTALACIDCNRHKGSDLTAIDPISNQIVRVFDPRNQQWHDHFYLDGATILGMSATGRATVIMLRLNDPMRVLERSFLIEVGRYPI